MSYWLKEQDESKRRAAMEARAERWARKHLVDGTGEVKQAANDEPEPLPAPAPAEEPKP